MSTFAIVEAVERIGPSPVEPIVMPVNALHDEQVDASDLGSRLRGLQMS